MKTSGITYPKRRLTSSVELCIVVPCYNEGRHFAIGEYGIFIASHTEVALCFVNDGSSDNTLDILNKLENLFPEQVEVLTYEKNVGKAEAVRRGVLYCHDTLDFSYIAYLDADLAVSLQECLSLTSYLKSEIQFCFGSRILKIGSIIERKRSRFLIGRVLATIISEMLSLKVYDTQCGCKLFRRELVSQLFAQPFISRWLFDIEIFFRMLELYGKEAALRKMIEVPLKQWWDKGDSKVKFSYCFYLLLDLYKIRRRYKLRQKQPAIASVRVTEASL